MLTASQVFDIKVPQYSSDANKASYIELARQQTNSCWFGTNYEYAVGLRAAHMIILDKDVYTSGVSSTGGVQSKKEGDLSISFHKESSSVKPNGNDNYLNKTNPGRELLALMRTRGISMGVINMPLCGYGYPG